MSCEIGCIWKGAHHRRYKYPILSSFLSLLGCPPPPPFVDPPPFHRETDSITRCSRIQNSIRGRSHRRSWDNSTWWFPVASSPSLSHSRLTSSRSVIRLLLCLSVVSFKQNPLRIQSYKRQIIHTNYNMIRIFSIIYCKRCNCIIKYCLH